MTSLYYFNEHLRWTLFWDNPNCWAAFLVFVLVGLWTIQRRLRLKVKVKGLTLGVFLAVHVVELGGWFLLVKTYSRGGLVTAIVALVLFFVLQGTSGGTTSVSSGARSIGEKLFGRHGGRPSRIVFVLAIRFALVAALCSAVGFASRISPGYIAQDKSVLNRLEMWQGALVMMRDSPWLGWGNNNGGFAYINWYQPQSMTSRPVGFVNSFLDVGVEFGTPALFAGLWVWVWLMLVALRLKNPKSQNPSTCPLVARQSQINPKSQISNSKNEPIGGEPRPFAVENGLMSAFVILTAWGVANIFTSLWRETALWIVPAGCAVYILAVWWRLRGGTTSVASDALSMGGKLPFARRVSTCDDMFRRVGGDFSKCPIGGKLFGRHRGRPSSVAFAVSAICVIVLLAAGWAFSGKYEWGARPCWGSDKITVIRRASHPVGASLATPATMNGKQASKQGVASDAPTVFADSSALGRYFGKTFRSIASKTPGERFEIYPPWCRMIEKSNPGTGKIIYTGFQVSWLARRDVSFAQAQEVVIFYPTVFPPVEAADIGAARVSLYMPPASASEYNLAWRRWAERNHVQIITAPLEEIPL